MNKTAIEYLALRAWAKKNDISTRMFLKEIRVKNSVKLFVKSKIDEFFGIQSDIFGDKVNKNKLTDLDFWITKYQDIFKEKNIIAILIEDFHKYDLLNGFGNESVVLYARGKQENIENILKTNIKNSFGIVGSRNTPDIYSKWIRERMPNKELVISGLANGADLIGHRVAIEENKKIVVFPGFNIDWQPPKKKMDVFNEALENGAVFSSIPPLSVFSPGMLQKRNGEMARLSSAGYVLFVKGRSGTYGYIREMIKSKKDIYLPKNIYRDSLDFMKTELNQHYAMYVKELA